MVDVKRYVENDFETIEVNSEKTESTYKIVKAENGYSQYKVMLSSGSAPSELSGMYTTPDSALAAVTKYLDNKRWTQAAKNTETAKRVAERKRKRNASESKPINQDTVQQGTTN